MGSYLIRRFFLMLLTLFGISVLIFTMLRLVPGNIADIVFNAAGMIDVAEKAKLEKELGLDQPMWLQYGRWVGSILFEGNKALVRPSVSGSYPSGHTTYVTVAAIMVATMVPEKRDAIWQRAWDYAQSRVIGGMHYPNDLLGGRLAGVPGIALISCRTAGLQARSYS